MTLKNVKNSSGNPAQSTLRDLKEGECGGCGTFENVTDNCCEECTKGYPNPTDQETIDALDYYNHHLKLMAKVKDEVQETDAVGAWKKIRLPADYSLKAELAKQQQDEVNSSENKPCDPPKGTGKSPVKPVLKGLSNIMGSGGLKRGELNIITSPNPRK